MQVVFRKPAAAYPSGSFFGALGLQRVLGVVRFVRTWPWSRRLLFRQFFWQQLGLELAFAIHASSGVFKTKTIIESQRKRGAGNGSPCEFHR